MRNRVCTVTMIKATLQDTLSFVNYHLNLGVDHIYLMFDDPKDEAIEVLSRYSKVTCLLGTPKYWEDLMAAPKLENAREQIRSRTTFSGIKASSPKKNNGKNELARIDKQELNASHVFNLAKDKYDWIIHLDSDELVYIEGSLKKLLSETPKNIDVLRMPSLEAVPEEYCPKNIFSDTTLFKSFGGIARFYYKHKDLLKRIFPFIRKHEGNLASIYFSGHPSGKSITRTTAKIRIVGIHEPAPVKGHELKYGFSPKAHLLHFDSCSFEEWKMKCLRKYDGTVIAVAMKKKAIEIYEKFVKAYEAGDEAEVRKVYADEYFIPPLRKFVFRCVGLLRRIRIKEEMFLGNK